MRHSILLAILMAVSFTANAASVSSSISRTHSYGHAVTNTTGHATTFEAAAGQRHIETATSGRDSGYTRSAAESTTYGSRTRSNTHEHSLAINGTRIGESRGQSQSQARSNYWSSTTGYENESGGFVSYDHVGDSYSYEAGIYSNTDDYASNTHGVQRTYSNARNTSAYDIY